MKMVAYGMKTRVTAYRHFECLKYAYENGCPWDENKYNSYKKMKYINLL